MGKSAGKVELAWLHLKDAAPWGYIFLGTFLAVVVFLMIASATGLMPTKWGPDGACGPRGMTLVDDCR